MKPIKKTYLLIFITINIGCASSNNKEQEKTKEKQNMTNSLPKISMQFDSDGTPYVIVEETRAKDLKDVIRMAPALADPHWIRAYSRVVNHLAQGNRFELIVDPTEFETTYHATYEAEDPNEEPRPGVMRLHNFGIPDFKAIKSPEMHDDVLVFYAKNIFMGIPYKAIMKKGELPSYEPVAIVE